MALMLLGGHGNVSVTANVAPKLMHELCIAAIEGDVRRATAIHMRLLPLHKQLFCEPSPAPAKWAMSQLGLCGPSVRLPIVPLTDAGQAPCGRPARQPDAGVSPIRHSPFRKIRVARFGLRSENSNVNRLPAASAAPARLAILAAVTLSAGLSGCSSLDGVLSGDKVDYGKGAVKAKPLEVPPDLSQLAKDSRYSAQSGVVSAAAAVQGGGPATGSRSWPAVAPANVGKVRIERQGHQRWLVADAPPEVLWPEVRAFWVERGFSLTTDNAQAGCSRPTGPRTAPSCPTT
jgi:hypothetical protein